jgi:hypothetical protein
LDTDSVPGSIEDELAASGLDSPLADEFVKLLSPYPPTDNTTSPPQQPEMDEDEKMGEGGDGAGAGGGSSKQQHVAGSPFDKVIGDKCKDLVSVCKMAV